MGKIFGLVLALLAVPTLVAGQDKGTTASPSMPLWAAQTAAAEITLGWGPAVSVHAPNVKHVTYAGAPDVSAYRIYKQDARNGRYHLETTLGATATTAVMRVGVNEIGAMVQYGLEAVPITKTSGAPAIIPFNVVVPRQATATRPVLTSVTAVQSGPAEVTVKWDAVSGATAYRIERTVQPTGFQTICQLCPAVNSIVDRTVDDATGAQVRYKVSAFTANGLSGAVSSNILTSTPKDVLATGPGGLTPKNATFAPTNLWAAQTSSSQVTLSWRAPIDGSVKAAEYRIYEDRDGRRRLITTLGGTATSAVVGLNGTGMQQFLIAGVVDSSVKDTSAAAVKFNPVTPAISGGTSKPAAPAPVTASKTGTGQITVGWAPVAGATAYLIERSKRPAGFQTICALCPTAPTYVDNDGGGGAVYVYNVTPYSAAGLGAKATSNELDLRFVSDGPKDTVTLYAPANANIKTVPPSTVVLKWDAATGAAGYRIRRSLNGGSPTVIATLPATARQYSDTASNLVAQNPQYIIESFAGSSTKQVTLTIDPAKASAP